MFSFCRNNDADFIAILRICGKKKVGGGVQCCGKEGWV